MDTMVVLPDQVSSVQSGSEGFARSALARCSSACLPSQGMALLPVMVGSWRKKPPLSATGCFCREKKKSHDGLCHQVKEEFNEINLVELKFKLQEMKLTLQVAHRANPFCRVSTQPLVWQPACNLQWNSDKPVSSLTPSVGGCGIVGAL